MLGYGYSDKPDPSSGPPNSVYNFDTWGAQCADFIGAVVGEPAFIIANRLELVCC